MSRKEDREKLFVQEYLANGMNGTKAYLKVYKTKNESTARANATKKLAKSYIKKMIEEQLKQMKSDTIATAQEIIEFFTSVMRDEEQKIKDRMRAGENLAKINGLFIEKREVKIDKIEIELPDDGDIF